MNLSNLDETTYDQALFTKTDIYRKMKNLMNTYDVYRLVTLDDIFVWSKVYHNNDNDNDITGIVVDFGDLLCVNDTKYLTIYRLYETMATDLMIFTGLNELVWNKLNIPIDINNIKTTSLLDIPSHIDLTQECDDADDEANDDADDADDADGCCSHCLLNSGNPLAARTARTKRMNANTADPKAIMKKNG